MNRFSRGFFALLFGAAFAATLAQTASATPTGLNGPVWTSFTSSNPATPNILHITGDVLLLSGYEGQEVFFLGRLADGGSLINPLQPDLTGATLSGTGLSGKSGDWTFTSGAGTYSVIGLEINAGFLGQANLYLTSPVANAGNWDTSDFGFIMRPNLNYLDFYGVRVAGVPEPASLLLLGGGLALFGLMGIRGARKRA